MARGAGAWTGLAALVLLSLATGARGLAVFGYVPEYRYESVDWEGIFKSTTHVALFSLEPTAEGELNGLDKLQGLLRPNSPFRVALKAASPTPKLLVSVGGAGRSKHFAAVSASKPLRRKLAKNLAKLVVDVPIFAGVDIDWETPQSEDQWRLLGKLAKDIRAAFTHAQEGQPMRDLLLSFTYHPGSGAVPAFSKLKAKKSDKGFVELFDFGHAMAYSAFDRDRRHSTHRHDVTTIEEWTRAGLPPQKLTLGMPFFGVRGSTGETKTYGEILDKEPSLYHRPDVDETSDGIYFINAASAAKKVDLAKQSGIAGIMIWELGQDKRVSTGLSLLARVWDAVKGVKPAGGAAGALLATLFQYEDQAVLTLTVIIGSYLLLKVLVGKPPPAFVPPERPKGAPQPDVVRAPEPAAEDNDGAEDDEGAGGDEDGVGQ